MKPTNIIKVILLAIGITFLSSAASAGTVYVPSATYPTIQSAMSSPDTTLTVQVAPGTYTENVILIAMIPVFDRNCMPTTRRFSGRKLTRQPS